MIDNNNIIYDRYVTYYACEQFFPTVTGTYYIIDNHHARSYRIELIALKYNNEYENN